jgi:hypothetical protein
LLDPSDQLRLLKVPVDDLQTLSSSDRGTVRWFSMPGGELALVMWQSLRESVQSTGLWPVILGDANEIARFGDLVEFNTQPVTETIEFAKRFDFDRWAAEQSATNISEVEEEAPGYAEEIEGQWPRESVERHRFTTPFDVITRKSLEQVAIALVPTRESCEVPAFIRFGGWNDCPEPAVHCAAFRAWQERFGAEIVAMTHDVIEARVATPPDTREHALRLARQQFGYCPDIVTQGTQSIAQLGAALIHADAWLFWWD